MSRYHVQSGVQTLLAALQRTLSSLASDICGDWRIDVLLISFCVQVDFAKMLVDPLNTFQRLDNTCLFYMHVLEDICIFKKGIYIFMSYQE